MASVLVGALSIVLASCDGNGDASSEDDDSSPPEQEEDPTSENEAFCDAARAVVQLDDDVQGILNDLIAEVMGAGDRAAAERELEQAMGMIRDELTDTLPDLVETYERMESAAPTSLAPDISLLSDFTGHRRRATFPIGGFQRGTARGDLRRDTGAGSDRSNL